MKMKYQQLGIGWNDKKYDELGTIVKDCNKALNDILQIMLQAEKYVASLAKSVQEYDNVNLDTPSARNSFLQGLQTPNVGNSSYQYCLGVLTQGSTPDGYIAVISQRHENAEQNVREVFDHFAGSGVMGIITAVFAGISTALSWLWVKFCMLFLMWSMRQNEYLADEFAYKIGFGLELATVLDKGTVQELFERLDAGRRKREQQGHILAAAQQVDVPHILACLAAAAVSGRTVFVHRAGRAGAARLTDAGFAVYRRAERLGVLVILTAFRPQGIGRMVVENDAFQVPGIIRIVRVFRRDLKLQGAAGGNFHPLETHHLQAVRILCDLIAAEITLHHRREQESVPLRSVHHSSVLFIHSSFLLKIGWLAATQAAIWLIRLHCPAGMERML